jgi:hypothetical protein
MQRAAHDSLGGKTVANLADQGTVNGSNQLSWKSWSILLARLASCNLQIQFARDSIATDKHTANIKNSRTQLIYTRNRKERRILLQLLADLVWLGALLSC